MNVHFQITFGKKLFTKSKLIKEDSLTKEQVDEIHCAKNTEATKN